MGLWSAAAAGVSSDGWSLLRLPGKRVVWLAARFRAPVAAAAADSDAAVDPETAGGAA
jgi:hypothetical protein